MRPTSRTLAAFAATTLAVVAIAIASDRAVAQPAPAYVVIAHPQVRVARVSREFLADVFLKRKTRWPGDKLIRPVDLDARSSVRKRFSDDVLRRTTAAVRNYWRQIVFSGRGVPPPELDDDRAVVDYVLRHEGAVGYVSSAAAGALGGAKLLEVD
jgi:hypothetical protein